MKKNILWGVLVLVLGLSLFTFGLINTNFASADFTVIDSSFIAFEVSVIIGGILMLLSMILFSIAISQRPKK